MVQIQANEACRTIEPLKPLHHPRKFSDQETIALNLKFANLLANMGFPKNTGEKREFQDFLEFLGVSGFRPTSKTVSKFQTILGKSCLEGIKELLVSMLKFSPTCVSAMTDVWKSPARVKYMGVRLTGINPFTIEPFSFFLPMQEATSAKLNAQAQAQLIRDSLDSVDLTVDNIFSFTTDTANTAKASINELSKPWIACMSHVAALCLKDCVPAHLNSKSLDSYDIYEAEFERSSKVDQVRAYLVGVAGRAAFFNQSSEEERNLCINQEANQIKALRYRSFAETRWPALFECISRDLRIIRETSTREFLAKLSYTTASTRKRLLQVSKADVSLAKRVRAIIYPLYLFVVQSQKDELSLGEGFILALSTLRNLSSDRVKAVDDKGFVILPTGLFKMISNEDIGEPCLQFRQKLRASVEKRLVDEMQEDEILLSVYLNPNLMASLRSYVCGHLHFPTKCSEILQRVLGTGRRVALKRMLPVSKMLSTKSLCLADKIIVGDLRLRDINDDEIPDGLLLLKRALQDKEQINHTTDAITNVDIEGRLQKALDDFEAKRDSSTLTDLDFFSKLPQGVHRALSRIHPKQRCAPQ
eukprot:TRINITY_DN6695_c0_g1_i1.p1 TRINITY_DN6695_c0_g1~~TRINITY_DN6695_c0_g1_i1.p1  ORF type:complete len:608 (+),score=35.26 TRINITY_DN6695_c0_g1_i1:64-1824(+)